MANSLDLDFALNSVFKKFLKVKVIKNRQQLVRCIRHAWSMVEIATIRRALLSWKKRVGLMMEKCGYQYEQDL